jgi:hypothetical protein
MHWLFTVGSLVSFGDGSEKSLILIIGTDKLAGKGF